MRCRGTLGRELDPSLSEQVHAFRKRRLTDPRGRQGNWQVKHHLFMVSSDPPTRLSTISQLCVLLISSLSYLAKVASRSRNRGR